VENRDGHQVPLHHVQRVRGHSLVVHGFVGLGADGRFVHVPPRRRVADKNNKRDRLRVQVYRIRLARVRCTI